MTVFVITREDGSHVNFAAESAEAARVLAEEEGYEVVEIEPFREEATG